MMRKGLLKKGISWLLSAALIMTSMSFSGWVFEEEASADTSYQLVWSDEFEGNALDTSVWTYEIGTGSGGWGNNELQYYTDRTENVSVSDGNLHITARKEDYNGSSYTSGRIISYKKAEFTYGRIEARIKVPQANGLWPAFWMLGSDYQSNVWPTCGEIDIMESVNAGNTAYGTVHWGVNGSNHAEYGNNMAVSNMGNDYHVYSIEWNEEYIKWFVDGVQFNVIDIKAAASGDLEEFHHDYFLIFNMAVGGNWPGFDIDDSRMPISMDVDYVRVYQLQEDTSSSNVEVPQNLSYTESGNSSVIRWNGVNGATQYKVYRADSRYANYTLIGTTAATSYTDNATGYYYKVSAVIGNEESAKSEPTSYEMEVFGKNVYVFEQTDDMTAVQNAINDVYSVQYTNQFGDERAAILFQPGYYNGVTANVGFYTQAAGLGLLPTDTTLDGLNVGADWMWSEEAGFNATCNFWRSANNLNIANGACWAVAQATSLRRMKVNGALFVDYYGQGWASGGFMADCVTTSSTCAYSQQQWISRNCDMTSWSGGVWNAVLVGCQDGLLLDYDPNIEIVNSNWDNTSYPYLTVADKTPLIRETPYIYVENNEYYVYVPAAVKDSEGVSWVNGNTPGKSYSIDDYFYVAKAGVDTAATMNAALKAGKNLLLTPGIYEINQALQVNYENQIVLGMGYATLRPTGNHACIETADVGGQTISSLLFDAGPEYTYTMLRVGEENSSKNHAANPTLLSDLFFRVGGVVPGITRSETCIIINSNDVIGDNFWVWRADHGDGVSWAGGNQTKNGIIINGDYVNMYGLFVEHFHEYQTIWNGNYGTLYFYQSEIPYDIPNQESWLAGDTLGYASFKVADDVTDFRGYGIGIYSYNRDAEVYLESAMEVPDAPGVSVNDICIVCLNGHPGINHVINGVGGSVATAGERQQVIYYSNGEYSTTNYINGYDYNAPTYRGVTPDAPGDVIVTPDDTDPEETTPEETTPEETTPEETTPEETTPEETTPEETTPEETTPEESTPEESTPEESKPPVDTSGMVIVDVTKNSSIYASTEMQPAENAIDGNANSRWESEIGVDPQWIYLDMGGTYDVTEVIISWEAASAKTYEIQVSDDAQNWTTVKTITDGASGETRDIVLDEPASGRYVRIYGTSRNLDYGYSIFEINVLAGVNDSYFDGKNLALGKDASASSQENDGSSAAMAVDGSDTSRWSSEWNDNEWIMVDLERVYRIDEVRLIWEAAYGNAYEIQVSEDGTAWTTVYTETNGDGGTDSILLNDVTARYIKMQGQGRATAYGYSMYELQAYGGLVEVEEEESSTEETQPEETQPEETSPSEEPSESESSSEEPSEESSEESDEESKEPLVTPTKVTGVKAVYEDGQIKLTWDNNDAVQYRVMRFTSENGYTTMTYKATADGYVDTDLIPAQLYYYRICGYFYDADGKLVQGNVSDSVAVVATDIAPEKVENVKATISDGSVTLTWDAPAGVRYYKIARANGWTTADGSYTCLKYNVSETTYTDSGLSAGKYRYKVVGYYKDTDGSWVYGTMSDTLFLTVE